MKHFTSMTHTLNKCFFPLLAAAVLFMLPACKDLSRKAAKETAERVIARGAREGAGELSGKTLKEIGESAVRTLPSEVVMSAMKNDNPILADGLKRLSRSFRRKIVGSIQSDRKVYYAVANSPAVLDDFFSFSGKSKKALNDVSTFRWYAHSEFSALESGAENPLKAFTLVDEGGRIVVLDRATSGKVAELEDGIFTLTSFYGDEGGHILSQDAILFDELRPNSIYKYKGARNESYLYNVDDYGRLSSVKVKDISREELQSNVLALADIDLGDDIDAFFAGAGYGQEDLMDLTVSFRYPPEDVSTPTHVVFEGSSGSESFVNRRADRDRFRQGVDGFVPMGARVTSRMEGDDALRYVADHNPDAYNLLLSLIDYPGTTPDKFIVEVLDNGGIRISHNDWGASKIEINGRKARVVAGSVAGAPDQSLNQMLNTRMPNMDYEVDGYITISTDHLGRPSETRATITKDNLIERAGQRDTPTQKRIVESQDGQTGDEGGHLVQRALGGPNELGNQVPMAFDVNHSVLGPIEKAERNAVEEGKTVVVVRKVIYEGDSRRPAFFIIDDTVDGEPIRVTINGKEYLCPIKVSNTSPAVIEQLAR